MDGVKGLLPKEPLPPAQELMAAIRNHCDAKGLKGKERAAWIREFKRLVLERLGTRL